MSIEAIQFLAISAGMGLFFLWGKVSVDLIGLFGLLLFLATGLLTSDEMLSGFSSPVTVTLAATFMVAGALRNTGVVDTIARRIAAASKCDEGVAVLLLMLVAAFFSAFMNNTAATALLMPTAASLTRLRNIKPSILFMPLAFGSLLGGTLTLVGTPPNIVASELLVQQGYERFRFFDFTPHGLLLVVAGCCFTAFVLRRSLDRKSRSERTDSRGTDDLNVLYGLREHVFRVRIGFDSPWRGKEIRRLGIRDESGLVVLGIDRGENHILAPPPTERILEGDSVVVLTFRSCEALSFLESAGSEVAIESDEVGLIEAVVAPRSSLTGKTLRDSNFRDRFQVQVIAMLRDGTILFDDLSATPLQVGDTLLIHGRRRMFELLDDEGELLLLGNDSQQAPRRKGRLFALSALALLVAIPLFTPLPIQAAAVAAMLVVTLSGTVTPQEGYREVDWRVLVLLAALIPLGIAMKRTGLPETLATFLIHHLDGGPVLVVLILMVLASLVSQILDASLAVLLIGPVAISVAEKGAFTPQSMMMAVTLASSLSFLTPISHRANLLVQSAGNYRMRDFMRVGLPLTAVTFGVVLLTCLFTGW